MSEIIYDLFLVTFGIVLGVIASDPLKKIFTGKYKEEARQKKRVKLLVYIRQSQTKSGVTTEELAEKVFSNKIDIKTTYELLREIEEIGLIKAIKPKDTDHNKTKWVYNKNQ